MILSTILPVHYIAIDATGCEYVCEDRDHASALAKHAIESAITADKAEIARLQAEFQKMTEAWRKACISTDTAEVALESAERDKAALMEALAKIRAQHAGMPFEDTQSEHKVLGRLLACREIADAALSTAKGEQ